MSLNRCEEALLHYLRRHPDEHRFWTERVREVDRTEPVAGARAARLERELRAYAAERAGADANLRDILGGGVVRLRNLAEYLLTLWTPPRRPPARASQRSST